MLGVVWLVEMGVEAHGVELVHAVESLMDLDAQLLLCEVIDTGVGGVPQWS